MDDIKEKLPEEFLERMRKLPGLDFQKFYESYELDNEVALRLNRLKIKAGDECLERYLEDAVPWCADGYYYKKDLRPGRSVFHEMGLFYMQEPSAMAVGELAQAEPGEKVLDLCAAPGGKTTHLAGFMKGEGLLVSNEIDAGRAKILSQNVERMGIRNCLITNHAPGELVPKFTGFFDRIVVDSPCSGEGMFKKEEAALSCWSVDNINLCQKRSKEIVDAAIKMLAPGGVLVYSTCTFAPEEDEQLIRWILENYSYMSLYPSENEKLTANVSQGIKEFFDVDTDISGVYRIWPHLSRGEGHFFARLKKDGKSRTADGLADRDNRALQKTEQEQEDLAVFTGKNMMNDLYPEVNGRRDKKNKKTEKNRENAGSLDISKRKIFETFMAEYLNVNLSGKYELMGDNLYLLPEETPSLAGIRVMRAGLLLGTFKKDRFEPSHALALALKKEEVKQSVETDRPDMYIEGNTVNCSPDINGWVLVTYAGYPVGFGKASGGVVKNHYPKGLRCQRDM